MLIAALGASAISQLYDSLKGQGTGRATTTPQPAQPQTASDAQPDATPPLGDSARKRIGDLNTFLLDLQAKATATQGGNASGADPNASAVPPSPLQIELQRLNEAQAKAQTAYVPNLGATGTTSPLSA